MQQKLFDPWNGLKKELNNHQSFPFVNEGDVWFCSVGINVGQEQDGKHGYFERPVLVVRRWSRQSFLGIPLTSKSKQGNYFFRVEIGERVSWAMFAQIRTFDCRRLQRCVGKLAHSELYAIRLRLRALI